jgi:glycosyltransferase involved in cell wall biosynthesis
MKVIHILPYSSLVTSPDFKVDLFADGFHVRVAREIWKRTKKYQIECWRAERKLKKAIRGEKDGITYRAFPSFRPTLGYLDKFVYKGVMATYPYIRFALLREYSLSMLREIKRQCQEDSVLVQIYSHSDLALLICLYLRNVPTVGVHIGAAPWSYSPSTFISHFPLSLVEKKALRNVDMILASSRWIKNILAKFHPHIILCAPTLTIDFNKFQPIAKKEARNALGIPLNKRVLLHVGRFDSAKGVDTILKAYQQLKSRYDLELILIGGLKTDPLYHEAIKSGATVREWLSQPELIPYYSAADVYLFARFYSNRREENLEEFMGIGTASLESLACGTPVVGTNLRHFLGTKDELKGVGKIPSRRGSVVRCIAEVLEHPEDYRNCREITRKYYSWDVVIEQLVGIYDELSNKYYK